MGRKRYIFVCSNCKVSKRKCDQSSPCGNCVKLGKQNTCTYLKDNEKYAPYVISASQPLNMKNVIHRSKGASTMDRRSDHSSSNTYSIPYSTDFKELPSYEIDHSNKKLGFTTRSLLLNQDRAMNDAYWNILTNLPYTMLTGVNPCISSCDTINFTLPKDAMRGSLLSHPERSSPLGWMSMTLHDPALALLWSTFSEVYKTTEATDLKSESFLKELPLNSNNRKKRIQSVAKQDPNSSHEQRNPSQISGNRGNVSDIDTVSLTLKIIPKKTIVDKLVSTFFEWIYPYMPFLNESFFTVQLSRILEYNSDTGKIKKLNIYDLDDYSYLGILLVIMRFTYLAESAIPSTNFNSKSTRCQSNAELPSRFIVEQECVENAKLLLHLGKKGKQNSFSFFLLKLFLSLHRKYFPEDLDTVDDEEVCQINKELIGEAQHMLIPSSLHINNTQLSFLKKKIWNYLIITDLFQNSWLGCFRRDEKELVLNYDLFESHISNLINTVFDNEITKVFFSSCSLYESLKRLLSMILSEEGSRLLSFCDALTEFELKFLQDLGSLEVCRHISANTTQEKVFKQTFALKYKLSVSNLLMVIFWNLFIKSERRNINTAYFYLKKLLLIILEIYSSYEFFTSDENCVFTLITNPFFSKFVHRSSQILLALYARVSVIMKRPRSMTNAAYELELDCFKNHLYHCIKYGYMTLEKQNYSNRNVNPLKKLHEILLSLSESENFTKSQEKHELSDFLSYNWLCLFHLKETNDMFRSSFSNTLSDTTIRENDLLLNDFNTEINMNPELWNELCLNNDTFFDSLLEF